MLKCRLNLQNWQDFWKRRGPCAPCIGGGAKHPSMSKNQSRAVRGPHKSFQAIPRHISWYDIFRHFRGICPNFKAKSPLSKKRISAIWRNQSASFFTKNSIIAMVHSKKYITPLEATKNTLFVSIPDHPPDSHLRSAGPPTLRRGASHHIQNPVKLGARGKPSTYGLPRGMTRRACLFYNSIHEVRNP